MKKRKGGALTFENILEPVGVLTERLSHSEEKSIMQRWQRTFSKGVKQQTGSWIISGLEWNAFAGKYAPHVEGQLAIDMFNKLYVKEYTIIAGDNLSVRCQGRNLPSYDDFMKVINSQYYEFDTYVSHINLNWTFVITHDKFTGPFFAENQDRLK